MSKDILPRLTEGEQALLKRAQRLVQAGGILERSRERFDRSRRRKTLARLIRNEEARA